MELGGGAQSRPAAGVGAGCLWENNSQPFVWPGSTQCRDGVGRMGGEHRVGTGPEGRAGAGGGESLENAERHNSVDKRLMNVSQAASAPLCSCSS